MNDGKKSKSVICPMLAFWSVSGMVSEGLLSYLIHIERELANNYVSRLELSVTSNSQSAVQGPKV